MGGLSARSMTLALDFGARPGFCPYPDCQRLDTHPDRIAAIAHERGLIRPRDLVLHHIL